MTRLIDLTLCDAAELIANRELSPVDLTNSYLERIEQTEPLLNAYVTICADQALEEALTAADEISRRGARGVLHGIPVGVKDLIDTGGVLTAYGSALYAEHVPGHDARVVADLKQAGAVILGKQATHELAWGGRTDSPFFGPTRNPYAPARVPGGSSGGAGASLAARSSLGAVGTDTAGSVRIPAALSGCVGLKPTRGSLSLNGVMPLAPTLDHVGLLGRCVADVRALFAHLVRRGEWQRSHIRAPVRVGRLRGWPDALVADSVRDTLDHVCLQLVDTGVQLVDVVLPNPPGPGADLLDQVVAEAIDVHDAAFRRTPDAFGADVRELLARGRPDPRRLAEARAATARAGADLVEALVDCEVLLGATVSTTAPRIGETEAELQGEVVHIEYALTRLTSIANAVGAPALSVPVGLAEGLPVGLQVIGRHEEEQTVFETARLVESLMGPLPQPVV